MKIKNKYYKNQYFFVFYDEHDEDLVATFDNLKDIAKYRKMDVTPNNVRLLNVELLNALKRVDHYTRMLNGTPMHVYLVDINDTEE